MRDFHSRRELNERKKKDSNNSDGTVDAEDTVIVMYDEITTMSKQDMAEALREFNEIEYSQQIDATPGPSHSDTSGSSDYNGSGPSYDGGGCGGCD